jgi:hypothetical protein
MHGQRASSRRSAAAPGGSHSEALVNNIGWPRQLWKRIETYFLQLFGWEIGDYSN